VPRKNRYVKKKLVVSKIKDIDCEATLDGLPILSFKNGDASFFPINKSNGNQYTVVFSCDRNSYFNQLKSKQRKGKIIPTWFPTLYAHNTNLSIELARIFVARCAEKYNNSNIDRSFRILSTFIIDQQIVALDDLDYDTITALSESINNDRAGEDFAYIKKIISLSVSTSKNTKLRFSCFDFNSSNREITTLASAEKRIADWKAKQGYSDFVMFQIYAYVNAAITEIAENHNRVKEYRESIEFFSVFDEGGAERFKKLVANGEASFDEALLVALTDTHCVNKVFWMLKNDLTSVQYDVFKEGIMSCDTLNLIDSEWPTHIQENSDVIFVCERVIPQITVNSKLYANILFPAQNFISFDSLVRRYTLAWSRYSWGAFYEKYKTYIKKISTVCSVFDVKETSTSLSHISVMLGHTEHFDFLLEVLLIAESGRNKEVIESIPAKVGNVSSLDIDDRFASESSILLTGYKERGHVNNGGKQPESLSIPKKSTIYQYLTLFDKIRRLMRPTRKTFFTESLVIAKYQKKFAQGTKIKEKDGTVIKSVSTPKFRKVFAGEVLQKWMKKITNKDDLVRAVAGDLKNTIPLHYLLQSSSTEDMLSTAIVALQMKFIEHHQRIAVTLVTNESASTERKSNKPRFLCECIDPHNPDYSENLNVSYCKEFDNCLGCSKAEIYREHLPRIIYRCFQYEEILRENRELYDAFYTLKHSRAKSVVDTFVSKISNGEKLLAEAVASAASAWDDPNNYLLPPLLHANT
jgi:hypothetical protein